MLLPIKELADGDTQRRRHSGQALERRIAQAALDTADVGSVEPRPLGKTFLRNALRLSKGPNPFANLGKKVVALSHKCHDLREADYESTDYE